MSNENGENSGGSSRIIRLLILGTSAALGYYAGIQFLIPAILASVIWFVCLRTNLKGDTVFVGALALQGAHAGWMLIGVFLGSADLIFIIETVIFTLLVILLAVTKNRIVIYVLIVYQLFAGSVNLMNFLDAPLFSVASRALIVHIGLRVFGIGFMMGHLLGVKRIRRAAAIEQAKQ